MPPTSYTFSLHDLCMGELPCSLFTAFIFPCFVCNLTHILYKASDMLQRIVPSSPYFLPQKITSILFEIVLAYLTTVYLVIVHPMISRITCVWNECLIFRVWSVLTYSLKQTKALFWRQCRNMYCVAWQCAHKNITANKRQCLKNFILKDGNF